MPQNKSKDINQQKLISQQKLLKNQQLIFFIILKFLKGYFNIQYSDTKIFFAIMNLI